jgi:hypothetical protein
MKTILLITTLVFSQMSLAANILCSGKTDSGRSLNLRIQDLDKKDGRGFGVVNIQKRVGRNYVTISGCEDALIAGEKNRILLKDLSGDLYAECAGDGDAGNISLIRVDDLTYEGELSAAEGMPDMGLDQDETVSLNCNLGL